MNPAAEQLYYYLLLFTLGSASLAFFYHLILYWQRKEALMLQYCIYLFFLSAFLLSRVLLTTMQIGAEHRTWTFQFWDELLQLLLYYGYIEFVGKALDIRHNHHQWMYRVWKTLAVTILAIALLHVLLMLTGATIRNSFLFRSSRALLIILSLLVLLVYAFKNKTIFQRYILIGALLFLVSGSLAFASYVFRFQWGNFYALSFTFLGELADVLLFSAAMGYRLRQTYEEKEKAMKELEEQRQMLMQKDIERMEAIVETRYHERNRIARELHDEIGSSLSSIHIFSTVASDPGKMPAMVEKIRDTSGRIMENMSDLVWAINAETDDMQSLLRRIRQFGASLLEAKNIELEVPGDNTPAALLLKTDAKKNILLICKEAINNIAKYSQASKVQISIVVTDKLFRLDIHDNGTGFNPGNNHGNGLHNMRKRCEESGGHFTLSAENGNGTRISCLFPVTTISS